MSERSDAKIAHALYLLIFTCGGAFSLYLIIHPEWRIVGVIMAAGVAMMLPTLVLPILMDDMPQAIRKLAFRGWHGKYRAFEGQRVRVIEGERHVPSRVFACDIFKILGQSPSLTDLEKLEARYGSGFEKGTEEPAEDEWLFVDEVCVGYVRNHMDEQRTARGRDAMKLALWLERDVLMSIDNRRTAETGKTFAFTKETTRR
jgi:hypothetical protein